MSGLADGRLQFHLQNAESTCGRRKKRQKKNPRCTGLENKLDMPARCLIRKKKKRKAKKNKNRQCDKNIKKLTSKLKRVFAKTMKLKHGCREIDEKCQNLSCANKSDVETWNTVEQQMVTNSSYVALDCEMVGVGRKKTEALGRFAV